LVLNQYITKPKKKMWRTWHTISQMSDKVGGTHPRVSDLIAPMTLTLWRTLGFGDFRKKNA